MGVYLVLVVKEDLEGLGAVHLAPGALAHDLRRVHNVLHDTIQAPSNMSLPIHIPRTDLERRPLFPLTPTRPFPSHERSPGSLPLPPGPSPWRHNDPCPPPWPAYAVCVCVCYLEDGVLHGREGAGAGAGALGLGRPGVALAQDRPLGHDHHVRAATHTRHTITISTSIRLSQKHLSFPLSQLKSFACRRC